MMGSRQVAQGSLFYGFSIDDHVPQDHLVRRLDRYLDLSEIRGYLAPYYSDWGRPSIDPELMIRMLLVGYCFGVRSERRLCEEVHVNLAFRWFCRLDLTDPVPDHSSFSKTSRSGGRAASHGRFRDSDLFRYLFETVLTRCIAEGLVGGEAFGVDASIVQANAKRLNKVDAADWTPERVTRAVEEYFETLDDEAFGEATPVKPKVLSPVDPAARFTGAKKTYSIFAYSTNYLVDLDNAVIVDVETTAPIRQAEVGAALDMLDRTEARTGLYPERFVGDGAYGNAETLGWLVNEKGIEPHVPVIRCPSGALRSKRREGTNRAATTAPSPAPTSPSRRARTATYALPATSCCRPDAPSRRSAPSRRTMRQSNTGPPRRTARPAPSRRAAARRHRAGRSRGRSTRAPATSLERSQRPVLSSRPAWLAGGARCCLPT